MPIIMPAATAPAFGVTGGVTFQSRSVDTKFDKKEAINNEGELCGWAFYGKMADHSIELLGTDALTYVLGASESAPSVDVTGALTGTTVFVVDELVLTYSGDDFVKSSVKVSEYQIED